MISLVFAALAAIANAASSLLQRAANLSGSKRSLPLNPLWLLGVGAALFSFLLQVGALSIGSLAAVEPVLALELVLVVLGSGIFFKAEIDRRGWAGVIVMTLGTVLLITALNPQKNDQAMVSPLQWTLLIGSTIGIIVATAISACLIKPLAVRGGLLGVATGCAFGLASCLMKGTVLIYQQNGLAHVISSWLPYSAIVAGVGSFWLLQITLRTAKLIATQPGVTLADPLIAIIWGNLIFHEPMNGGWYIVLAAAAAVVLIIGTIILSRSHALSDARE